MKISKIFKFILLLVLVVLLLLFWKTIVSFVISINLEMSQRNVLVLTFIYWIELLILLLMYDLVLMELSVARSCYLGILGRFAVRKKKADLALFIIILDYYLLRLNRMLRLGWISYGSDEKSKVWVGLSKPSFSQILCGIFKILTNFSMLFAFLSALFSLELLRFDIDYYLPKIRELLHSVLQVDVNMSDAIAGLPALVTLITVVPTIFFFYFYSQKRDVRKIIDKKDSQYFEEVVLLYEELLIWIDSHIYDISKNFDYVINCQDSIVDVFLKKKIPNYISLTGNQYYHARGMGSFKFIEISDLSELQGIITKLTSDRLVKFTKIFSVKRFDIWYLYSRDFKSLSKVEEIEMSFYTQKGMVFREKKRFKRLYDFSEEQFRKEREEELMTLSESIYDDLELLYRLRRASNSLRAYLYSSRTERLLLKALNKDK